MTLLRQLVDALAAGRPVCYTALVDTRGSTPQKPGARMLVFPDGSQVGTLGGGCVEAEVKRRALALLDDGSADLLTFTLDHDYGWDDGLICGGRMTMLVDPLRTAADTPYYQTMLDLTARGDGFTEVVSLDAASGFPPATQLLLDGRGALLAARRLPTGAGSPVAARSTMNEPPLGWMSSPSMDGSPPASSAPASSAPPASALPAPTPPASMSLDRLAALLRPLSSRPRAYLVQHLACLPVLRRCRLVIVGGGHVGQKVAELAAEVGFDVWILDDRETYCTAERFPHAQRRVCAPFEQALPGLEIGPDDFCIIVTRGHQHDEEALFHLAERPARYVGMIGSRRKIKMIFDDLRRQGISAAALERVHAPLGLDIGSQTVPEIAVSIVAELIAVRNGGAAAARDQPPA